MFPVAQLFEFSKLNNLIVCPATIGRLEGALIEKL